MKISSIGLAVLSTAFFATSVHAGPPPTVNPEQMDMGVEITAKIGKEKAKKNSMLDASRPKSGSSDSSGGGGSDCGTVNINSSDKKSNSGIKDMFGKQSTTIVTGPVINMATCK